MFLITALSKIARWRKIRSYLDWIIIISFITLFGILLVFFLGVMDFGEPGWIIVWTALLVLVISLSMDLVFKYYAEEIREAEQREEKQLLFKPATISVIVILFLIYLGISGILNLPVSASTPDVSTAYLGALLLTGGGLWIWYTVAPVFIFSEDSVQIKPYLFYLFHIDRKTVIRYADITQVIPDITVVSAWGGEACEYAPIFFMNGTTQRYTLLLYDGDTTQELWLRFKEKLGDKALLP